MRGATAKKLRKYVYKEYKEMVRLRVFRGRALRSFKNIYRQCKRLYNRGEFVIGGEKHGHARSVA